MDASYEKPSVDTGQVKGVMRLNTGESSLAAANYTTRSPMSSAPPTPSMRRTSHSAASPLPREHSPRSPSVLRRTSSSQSLNKQPSSPQPTRKGSRSSLGGPPDGKERRPTPKRSISNLIAGLREAQSTMEIIEEPSPLTAAQVATDHFARELLGQASSGVDTETLFVLHDACYGHRYSRLRATKTTLSMIVERPERLHASVLGASTAYVRLGEHHAGGKRAPHPALNCAGAPPFKIRRSGRSMPITSTFVTNVHGTSWMSELQGMCHSAPEKLAAGVKELSRDTLPGQPEKQKLHEGDLYLAPESLNAFEGALGAVADAVDAVFSHDSSAKRAFVAVRPPGHHCSADLPSGFCWLNNVHVGIEYAAQTFGLTHAVILDFDLHHGDGSQAITWQRNSRNNEKRQNAKPNSKQRLNPDIGYYSIHDINSYPCEMGDDEKVQAASLCIDNAHGQSIWNVHLQVWKTEDDFWRLYEEQYSVLFEKAKKFLEHHDHRIRQESRVVSKSAIFLSAGFDASEWEGSGMQRHKVNVPTEFYARFAQDAVKLAQSSQSCAGRVISVLEGGYSDRALCTGVLSHLSGLCVGGQVATETNPIGSLLQQMNGLDLSELSFGKTMHYDKTWWSAANMTALENKVNPPPPPQAKKGRTGPQPTYATPTESFAYKVVDPQKFARSVSGTMREGQMPARPPTPPPPEVDWVVATQELSKLLIPSHRQTKSCTAEELAVVRTKQQRQSAMPALSDEQAGQPRQLRDRRAKGPVYAESAHSDETGSVRAISRAESRSSRRETIDVLPSENPSATSSRRMSRRLSAGSTLSIPATPIDNDVPPVPKMPMPSPVNPVAAGVMEPPPVPLPRAQPVNPKTRTIPKARPAAPPAPTKPADVDSLTSGMKKVTLKVSTSKEEHDRKQKEKLDADRRARALKGAETRRVNAAAKKAAQEAAAQPVRIKAEQTLQPAQMPQLLHAMQPLQTLPPPQTIPTQEQDPTVDPGAAVVPAMFPGPSPGPMNPHQDVAGAQQISSVGDTAYTLVSFIPTSLASTQPTSSALPSQEVDAASRQQNENVHAQPLATQREAQDMIHNRSDPDGGGMSLALQPDTDLMDTSTSSSASVPFSAAPPSAVGVHLPNGDVMPADVQHTTASMNGPTHMRTTPPPRPTSSGKLPIWSSTGPIPFASTTNADVPQPQSHSHPQSQPVAQP